ncbi:MAG: translation elongation factor Ts [bacterium]
MSVTISAAQVKELRDKTGAGVMDCRHALVDAAGDLGKAEEILRVKGIKSAEKKAGRVASEGLVEAYLHMGSKLGVMIELNCETDFVAKTDEFKALARELAMQLAAYKARYISREEISQEELDNARQIFREQYTKEGKPANVLEKILEGRMEKYFEEVCLMDQGYIRDDSKKIRDLIKETVAKTGENILVKRFARFSVGEN